MNKSTKRYFYYPEFQTNCQIYVLSSFNGRSLTSLNLSGCENITDVMLEQLAQSLTTLGLCRESRATPGVKNNGVGRSNGNDICDISLCKTRCAKKAGCRRGVAGALFNISPRCIATGGTDCNNAATAGQYVMSHRDKNGSSKCSTREHVSVSKITTENIDCGETASSSLVQLNLSGCWQITDSGLW